MNKRLRKQQFALSMKNENLETAPHILRFLTDRRRTALSE